MREKKIIGYEEMWRLLSFFCMKVKIKINLCFVNIFEYCWEICCVWWWIGEIGKNLSVLVIRDWIDDFLIVGIVGCFIDYLLLSYIGRLYFK